MIHPSARPIEANGRVHLSEAEVAGYLDHDLSADERLRIEEHIDQCATCRTEIIALSRLASDTTSERTVPARRASWWVASVAAVLVVAVLLPRLTSHPPAAGDGHPVRRVAEPDGRAGIAVVSPANGATVGTRPVFTWRAASADLYRITVVTESGDPVWTSNTTETTIALPDSIVLQPGHAYYWHVDGIGNGIAANSGSIRFQIPRP